MKDKVIIKPRVRFHIARMLHYIGTAFSMKFGETIRNDISNNSNKYFKAKVKYK